MGKKGRGVFARNKIEKGRLIERVPIVVFPAREVFGSLRQSKLAEYVFNWDDNLVALSLGYGSLYNHSFRPNARFYYEGRLTQVFSAIRDIEEGEEITVDYNGPEKNFDVVE
jgi:hypothetical protein